MKQVIKILTLTDIADEILIQVIFSEQEKFGNRDIEIFGRQLLSRIYYLYKKVLVKSDFTYLQKMNFKLLSMLF